jgi:hypothetical protein
MSRTLLNLVALLSVFACIGQNMLADARFTVVPYIEGRRATDVEVCFFQGRAGDAFFDRFLVAQDVRCYPSDETIRVPSGTWNYFLQQAHGWVSSSAFAVTIGSDSAGDVKPMHADLLPAGSLDVAAAAAALRSGEHLALYITNDGQHASRPSVRPVPAGSSAILVPADMRLLLLIVRDEKVVWAGRPFVVGRNQVLKVPRPERSTTDVIAFLSFDSTVTPEDRQVLDGVIAPAVRLTGGTYRDCLHFPYALRRNSTPASSSSRTFHRATMRSS